MVRKTGHFDGVGAQQMTGVPNAVARSLPAFSRKPEDLQENVGWACGRRRQQGTPGSSTDGEEIRYAARLADMLTAELHGVIYGVSAPKCNDAGADVSVLEGEALHMLARRTLGLGKQRLACGAGDS